MIDGQSSGRGKPKVALCGTCDHSTVGRLSNGTSGPANPTPQFILRTRRPRDPGRPLSPTALSPQCSSKSPRGASTARRARLSAAREQALRDEQRRLNHLRAHQGVDWSTQLVPGGPGCPAIPDCPAIPSSRLSQAPGYTRRPAIPCFRLSRALRLHRASEASLDNAGFLEFPSSAGRPGCPSREAAPSRSR